MLINDVSDLDFVKKQEDYVFLLHEINRKIALARGWNRFAKSKCWFSL